MAIDKIFGAEVPGSHWKPSISHILRRASLLTLLQTLQPGSLLEIGCGAGRLLPDLAQLGYRGMATDASDDARGEAMVCVEAHNIDFTVVGTLPNGRSFDYVMALEVLEHIEDDELALNEWADYVASDGYMIISVPAFQKLFSAADEWAGHYRRYEISDIETKFTAAGFEIEEAICVGFPLARWLIPINSWANKRRIKEEKKQSLDATLKSGTDRSLENKYQTIIRSAFFRPLWALAFYFQRVTFHKHWGTGWVIIAKKVIA